MDIVDMKHVCGLAKAHGITSVVDNAFATAVLQRPMDFGADVVAYSATKLMEGQGRVLVGAVCGTVKLINDVLLPFKCKPDRNSAEKGKRTSIRDDPGCRRIIPKKNTP